ncbi:MAG: DEAD/DEAH box helicase [Proteobacteria bacterium]|nr:DEAD/DEAH box helicase [Pseudomonadota bacterium]
MSFTQTGLSEKLCKRLQEIGYLVPTTIQEKAIPVALRGQDIIGMAQTGTGKTAAFLLPILSIQQEKPQKFKTPSVLILEPTRELAVQVQENLRRFDEFESLKSVLLIGGDPMGMQERSLQKPHNIVIATPGRLLDFLERGKLLLCGVQHVVIDEADRMLDMGFIPDVDKIMAVLPKLRQTLLFSATMTPDIRKLVEQYMMLPKTIEVAGHKGAKASIEQFAILASDTNKREALREILHDHPDLNCVIFCNRKRDIDLLKSSLMRHKFLVGAIHGDMDQESRNKTLQSFKAGEISVLIASDVLARGVDIEGLGMVVNFNVPLQVEDYVHRIGRTGRADLKGLAFTLANPREMKLLANIEKHQDTKLNTKQFEPKEKVKEEPQNKVHPKVRTEKERPRSYLPHQIRELPIETSPVVGFGEITPAFMLRSALGISSNPAAQIN